MSNESYSSEMAAAASQSVKEREYWLEKLSGAPVKTGFPYDSSNPDLKSRKMETFRIRFPGELFSKLIWISNESDARLMMILVAGLMGLLNKYSGSKDIIVGMPIYKQETEGDFINTVLALRTQMQDNMTFRELLYLLKQTIDTAIENQNYPLRSLLYELNLPISEEDDFPLFDIAVVFENIQDRKYIQYIHTNMIFSFLRTEEHLECAIEYNRHLYYQETITRIAAHLFQLLQAAVSNVNAGISRIELLSEEEREKLLHDFNENRVDYPAGGESWMDKTIYQLFEEQVGKNPDNMALVFEGEKWTYREYNKKANQLARVLRKKGTGAKSITALLMENSIEMVVAIMAILKTGGAYLPIDMDVPEDRKKYILKDSGGQLLLTNDDKDGTIATSIPEGIETVNACDESIYTGDSTNPETVNKPSELAYVIYTSGSTGKPKGVMVEHRHAVNTLVCRKEEYKMTSEATALQLFSYAFDGFVTSFFTPIISGARVVLLSRESIEDIEKIVGSIVANKVTHFISVPILYQVILANITEQEASSLRVVTLAGDRVQPVILDMTASKSEDIEIVNEYGITEAAVMSTIYRRQERDPQIKIGRPIWNNSIYITRTGDHSQLMPIGVYGEMCIAGAGIARGYMNKPDLTVEKFVENPFVSGQEMLRTGDLAKWLPDGNIVFGGRRDFQVKIRGFRIELGEIEQELLKHEAIREVIVTAGEDGSGDKYLCAYIVSEREISISELREYLSASLSDYMIPPYFVFMDHLPLTSSGKVDRKQLPPPEISVKTEEYVAPRDDIERELVDLWADVLGVDKDIIGIDSNFFELGGHSLTATILGGRIHKEFNVKLPMTEVFRAPMIRRMSQYIKSAAEEAFASIHPAEEKEYYSLSSAQNRLYILQKLDSEVTAYNIREILELEGEVDKEKLEETFRKLIHRHESLRTSFHMVDRTPVQKVHPSSEIEFEIGYHDPEEEEIEETAEAIVRNFVSAFDLSQAPLIRVGLVRIEPLKHVLMVDMHHIISDGVSHSILIENFLSLYKGNPLPSLRLQYNDYSEWQQSQLEKESYKKQEEYWLKEFEEEIPVLNMPIDYPRPAFQNFEGKDITFRLNLEETKALNEIARLQGATLFMVVLAVYNILLSKICIQEDIVVGTQTAGRKHADLEQIIGMFVNALALRNYPKAEKTFIQFLQDLRKKTLEAFKNQDYQFENLVEKVVKIRDTSKNPLFDVVFLFQNIEFTEEEISGMKARPYGVRNMTAQFDLKLEATESGEIVFFSFEYCTKLYKDETIKRFISYFEKVVSTVIENPGVKIEDIEIISEEEKEQLIYKVNKTQSGYPENKSIDELFEEQVERAGDKTAVISKAHSAKRIANGGSGGVPEERSALSYRELNEKSNQLACLLREKGVKPDGIVGIMVDRSTEVIVGIMGILKAGGAYLPIEPDFPEERIKYMLADSNAKMLITARNLSEGLVFEKEIIYLENYKKPVICNPQRTIAARSPQHATRPKNLAYVIYTSGSSGNPKGVMVEHRNIVNYIWWAIKTFVKNEKINFPLFTSLSFDLTVTSIFVPLLSGNTIIVYEGYTKESLIERIIEDNQVGVMKLTPSHLKLILDQNINPLLSPGEKMKPGIKRFIVGGEALETRLAKEIVGKFNEAPAIYNEYGPTETAVGCMIYKYCLETDTRQSVPIGGAADNVHVYLFDKNEKPVPMGAAGELYISGEGVARGYLNQPELTEEKFIDNLFVSGKRMYKTGDLSRYLSDGNIEFLGRIDHQVKIRGFRIELGEIENKLMEYRKHKPISVVDNDPKISELKTIRRCIRCLLPANYPGIHFDNKGVCSVCLEYEKYKKETQRYFKVREDFKLLIEKVKKANQGEYDCLMLFSGGKDSSYVLYQLIDMGLKVLTLTFDNGYISDAAFANIKRITSKLGVKNIVCGAKNMNKVFVESLNSEHNVCHGCWNALNTMGAKVAHEKGINLVISGLSRGQIFEMRLEGLFQRGIFDENEIEENLMLFRKIFHSKSNKFSRILDVELPEEVVERTHFVDFFRYFDTPVSEIREYLSEKGWIQPEDTGFCSSNCIINDVGIYMYLKEEGYNFYAPQLSWDCRLGSITREEGFKEIGFEGQLQQVENILNEIGYYNSPIKDAVVIDDKNNDGDRHLAAYIVSEEELVVSELRDYLAKELPDYMIPSYFKQIEKIPVTPNGKVDWKALKSYSLALKIGTQYVEPGSEMEKIIADNWKGILKVDKVGIDDNFFDLGGNSLKAIQLDNKINQILGKDIPVVVMFEHVTIRSFVRYLSQVESGKSAESKEMDRSEVIDKVKKRRAERKSKIRRGRGG